MVASLIYAQVSKRLDIAFFIYVLGRYLSDPDQSHWKATKKVLRYLQDTKNLLLTYWCIDTFEEVGFSDSDYTGYVDDKKSISSYIFMMAKGVVSWKSVKQTFSTSSTMEAGYVTCYEAPYHVIWLRNFISTWGVLHSISRPLKLFCDNSAYVSISRNTSCSKHIDVKFYFVKEKVAKSLILVEHIPTTSMLANSRTKGLPICVF